MKTRMIIAVLSLFVASAFGQWLPVTVNTNTGVYKPYDIATLLGYGITNIYSTSGTVNRAYLSGRDAVVQFNTNVASSAAITNLALIPGSANATYVSNLVGYTVYSTNGVSPWVPTTNWANTNVILLYTFSDTNNPLYIQDMSGNGNNAQEVFGGLKANMFTNGAYKIDNIKENYIKTMTTSLVQGADALTIAMWVYPFSTTLSTGVDTFFSSYDPINTHGVAFYAISASGYSFDVANPTVSATVPVVGSVANIATMRWNRVVCVWKKTNVTQRDLTAGMAVYVNGLLITNVNNRAQFFATDTLPWTFGTSETVVDPYAARLNALIDDCLVSVQAWNYASVSNDWNLGNGRSNP